MANQPKPTTFIDPFVDFAFKRIFGSEESKPMLTGLLNQLLDGRKHIVSIEYSKNEHPGEINEEGSAIFDVHCTDADGSTFIIEIQRGYQENIVDRAMFYVSRAASEQCPKGNRKKWAYRLTDIYLIAFLEDFRMPESNPNEYIQDISWAHRRSGKIFSDRMNMIFIEMLNFVKEPEDLVSDLDKWLYALKHLTEFKTRPEYLNGPEFEQLFNLAKYTNLNREERAMYNRNMKYKWDNENVMDYAVKTARREGMEQGLNEGLHKKAVEMASKLKAKEMSFSEIAELTGLSANEIKEL
ncbi:Rpn family recombination-promoting nuclease/putative transposase [Pedobacter sp. JY14-1]|uniref:Rpn family recombination-promoting nuclease/putative transposase n=1 Tax=Pedobacter sp. JY14-1 TaxID=3034151 RepID=UPI0023E212EE|nr:Rpn family recombination-promoting nuclease/putative transposase [Pedobacter sp. JY14-1]